MRIAQVANFYGPLSGGLRTAMHRLGIGYREAGHDSLLIVPGPSTQVSEEPWGTVVTIASPRLPRSGGYRVITDIDAVVTHLQAFGTQRLEVSDRVTLRSLGWWARARGIPSVFWAHERVDGVLRAHGGRFLPARRLADHWNAATARRFDRIVATTAFAAEEFSRIGVDTDRVPLGVDLQSFRPDRRDLDARAQLLEPNQDVLLVSCTRLSREKRPDLAWETLRELRRRGVRARLVLAGSGPMLDEARAVARHLPMTVLGHVSDRDDLATLLASADVAIAPGPIETFGLAALEALASGTPVVASRTSALREIVRGAAGHAAAPTPRALAEAVRAVLGRPQDGCRRAARNRAEEFPWSRTVDTMLALHGLDTRSGLDRERGSGREQGSDRELVP